MLARRRKHRPWLKGKNEALALLAHIALSVESHDSLEESFQDLGEHLSKYSYAVGYAVYRYSRRKKCFSLHLSYGDDEAFKQQPTVSFQEIQDCGAQLTEFATLSSTPSSPDAIMPSLLHVCAEHSFLSLAYIPIVAHGSLQSLVWLVSKQAHHPSEADLQFFSVLMQHLRLSEEKSLLVEQFEQDVANKVSQLQESEEKYRVLFEDAGDAIVIVDFESQYFLEANRQTEYLLGYSKDELLTMMIVDFWTQKDEKRLARHLLSSVKLRGSLKLQERQIHRKDGSSLWVEMNVSSVEYRGKKAALAILRDASHRKQVELEKEVIEAVNKALLSSHDAYDMYDTMSKTLLNVFHFDRMDILLRGSQAHTARLFSSIQSSKYRSTLDEREFSFHETPIETVFQTGTPEIVSYQKDLEAPRRLSGFFDKKLKTSLFFPLGFKGHLTGILHFGSYAEESFSPKHFDFLQRIAMQIAVTIDNMLLFHAVNEERAVYKHLIENVNELVFQADPKGTILFVNHRVKYILGYTPEEITGSNFFACVIPEDLEEAKAAFRLTLRHERPLSGEFRVLHKNGRVLTISIYTRPIFEDGRSVGMQGIIQDMTPSSEHFTPHRDGLHELIGRSRKMQEIYDLITSVAKTDSTVLIHGESGTGKELIAQAVHASSLRHNKPFIVVNCAAYSEHLLESELFGHERGAFTGAHRRKLGRFELAKGGTIFLDEIGEIPPHSQVLLLRVLQNKSFERVGGEKTLETDVRIVAATNKNLEQEMKAGRFREDLYYRLNVIPIEVPPLRDRKEDIPHLVDHFRKKYSATTGKQVLNCSQSALEVLMRYNWLGNVRELENTIERAVVMASGPVITPADLPSKLRQEIDMAIEESVTLTDIQPKTLYEHEKQLISKTLRAVKWNKYQAAKLLGITRSTLYSKIQKYGLEGE